MIRKSLLAGLFLMSLGAQADNCRTEMLDYQGYLRLVITQAQPDWNDPYCTDGYRRCVASIRLNPNLQPSCRVVPLDIYGNPMYQYGPSSYECTTTTTTTDYYDDGTSRTRTTNTPCSSERPDPRPRPQGHGGNYPGGNTTPNPRPHWNPGHGGNTSGGSTTTNPRPHWNPPSGGSTNNPNSLPPSGTSSGGTIHPPRPIPENANGFVEIKPRIEVDVKALLSTNILMANGKEYEAEVFDGQRSIESGETVIMTGNTFTVISSSGSTYLIKPEGNHKQSMSVDRSQIAITRGCSYDICVTDAVYNLVSSRIEAVVGLTTEGELITKVQNEKINPNPIKLGDIAPAKGCSSNRLSQPICVGNTVQISDGRYVEVIAIQLNGTVVGRMNADRNYGAAVFANLDPSEMTVVR